MMSEQISGWIEQNKNKNVMVPNISIKIYSDTCESETNPLVGPGNLGVVPLNPPGPVSLILWHTDPEYRAGNFLSRKGILRDMIVKVNERFQNELKGRGWNRAKTIEQLQAQESSAISPPQNTPELNKALCHILNFQLIEVDENLYLASRNLVNVLVVEPRYADPVSLVHYRKVLVTKAAMGKLQEMFA